MGLGSGVLALVAICILHVCEWSACRMMNDSEMLYFVSFTLSLLLAVTYAPPQNHNVHYLLHALLRPSRQRSVFRKYYNAK